MKTSPQYATDAMRRLRVNNECQRIMTLMLERPESNIVDVAVMLGWNPPPVVEGDLSLAAGNWLDQRA